MSELINKLLGSARSLVCTPLKRVLNLVDPPVLVLLYHRVTTLASDPEMLAVTPDNFRAQMQHLKETVQLVRFEEDWTKISEPAVAVTFDDGYADNVLEALPILEEVGVPATFFVSTGTIGTPQEFWWHELEHLILGEGELPGSFTLSGDSLRKSWPTGSEDERQRLYHDIVALTTSADARRRTSVLAQLRDWGAERAECGDGNRALSVDELRRLAASSMVTIGAHTVNHLQLSALPPDAQREEMERSKRELETWLGREITTFSYPYGRRCHYTKESVALCRELGFSKAAANFPGQAHRWSDPYQVPRHLVRNWPVEEFAAKLKGFWTR
jgi:peptidoglycan/xylan/chitin deacetylase (PgdA/CDA1 family)